MPQGRFFRPKDKAVLGTKYDSTLEKLIDQKLSALLERAGSSGMISNTLSQLPIPPQSCLSETVEESVETTTQWLPVPHPSRLTFLTLNVEQERLNSPKHSGPLENDSLMMNDDWPKPTLSMPLPSQDEQQKLPLMKPVDELPKDGLLCGQLVVEFHASKVKYVIEKVYNPDFTITYPDGREVFVEAKGYFQDAQEIQKYDWVRDCLKPHQELVFVFEKPNKPIHFRSVRKDGTKMTHGEWAEKLKFRYFTVENVGELLT